MLNGILGAKLKLVKGYRSTNEILLAVQRDEVGGMIGIALDSFQLSAEKDPDIRVLFQMGLKRNPDLPDAPLIQEFAKTEEQKAVLGAVFASFEIGRIFAVADIPASRLEALRKAFASAVTDPAFIADAKKLRLNVSPETPEEVESIIADVYRQPTPILDKARVILSGAED
jgi:tripartite-type tricarboxylate transporter receptor subunit TctC